MDRSTHSTAVSRRRFLRVAGGACLAAGLTAPPALAARPGSRREKSPLLDAHAHFSSAKVTQILRSALPFEMVGGGGDELVKRLDEEGIQKAWVMSCAYMMASDAMPPRPGKGSEEQQVRAENDYTAAQVKVHADRVLPFLSVNPKRPYAEAEIDRCVRDHAMKGLKLHLWNSLVNVREKRDLGRLESVLGHAADQGLPVVVHAFNGQVADYGKRDVEVWARDLIQKNEKLKVCFAHLGGAGGFSPPIQAVFESLSLHLGPDSDGAERVRVDLSAVLFGKNPMGMPPTSPAEREKLGDLLDRWGTDRVLWGSDNIPEALRQGREAWPLEAGHWDEVCAHTGAEFMASDD